MKNIATAILLSIMVVKATPIAPEHVAVLYNSNIPESGYLAKHYAVMRNIPPGNLIGLRRLLALNECR